MSNGNIGQDGTEVKSVVIVGGGVAGASAAFELRKLGFDGSVTLVTNEQHLPYKRPPMSKEYLRGEQPIEKAYVKPADQYVDQNIQLIQGKKAESIDTDRRTITLDDRSVLPYDALLLATGSAARRLEVPGPISGVHYLRNVEDADAIRAAAMEAKAIVVIGGGWIGTEVAASLRQLGRNVTLVAPAPQPLENILGAEVAGVYRKLHEENGTKLVIGRVESIEGDGAVNEVVLTDGKRIPADMVVAGVGAAPRLRLARNAGLTLRHGGVEVDAYLQTSAAGVFAAGDIATAWHPRFGATSASSTGTTPRNRARLSRPTSWARAMSYERSPYFYSDQFDLGMEYRGMAHGWDDVVIRGSLEAREFDAFWLKDGRVIAAMNANRWDDADELQDLVDRQAELRVAAAS